MPDIQDALKKFCYMNLSQYLTAVWNPEIINTNYKIEGTKAITIGELPHLMEDKEGELQQCP